MAEPGEIYYSLSRNGQFVKMGVVESLDVSGEVPYELAENLSVISPDGFGRIFVNVMSPKHEASIRIRYVKPETESFSTMISRIAGFHKNVIYSRHSLQDPVYFQLVVSRIPLLCMYLVGYPSRFSWRVDAGMINVITMELTIPLINRDGFDSLSMGACYNLT